MVPAPVAVDHRQYGSTFGSHRERFMISGAAPIQHQRFPTRLDIVWNQIDREPNGAEMSAIASKITSAVQPGLYAIQAEIDAPLNFTLAGQTLFIVMELNANRSACLRIWPEGTGRTIDSLPVLVNQTTTFSVHGHRQLTGGSVKFDSSHADIESLFRQ